MKRSVAIDYYGTAAELSRQVGVSKSAVSQWKKKGVVPSGVAYKIESMTGGALKVDPACYSPLSVAPNQSEA